jgi:hypothetical protein
MRLVALKATNLISAILLYDIDEEGKKFSALDFAIEFNKGVILK